jgi:hypothetical protein
MDPGQWAKVETESLILLSPSAKGRIKHHQSSGATGTIYISLLCTTNVINSDKLWVPWVFLCHVEPGKHGLTKTGTLGMSWHCFLANLVTGHLYIIAKLLLEKHYQPPNQDRP